jgi:hypothetical protein
MMDLPDLIDLTEPIDPIDLIDLIDLMDPYEPIELLLYLEETPLLFPLTIFRNMLLPDERTEGSLFTIVVPEM